MISTLLSFTASNTDSHNHVNLTVFNIYKQLLEYFGYGYKQNV